MCVLMCNIVSYFVCVILCIFVFLCDILLPSGVINDDTVSAEPGSHSFFSFVFRFNFLFDPCSRLAFDCTINTQYRIVTVVSQLRIVQLVIYVSGVNVDLIVER